jgi:KRAB domain-containing zinc finger protein
LKHTAPEEFVCDKCNKQFNMKQTLFMHIKQFHNPMFVRLTYNCSYCPKKYNNPGSKHYHVMAKHMNTKSHHCQLCSYKCVRKWQLTKHLVTHDEYKVYKFPCEMCDSVFTLKGHLATHEKQIHSNGIVIFSFCLYRKLFYFMPFQ